MHDAVLAQAALPAPAVVLGMLLRPYSLGHELWLVREESPFLFGNAGDPRLKTALPAAVLICSQSWNELSVMRRDWLLSLKLWVWRRRINRISYANSREFSPRKKNRRELASIRVKPYLEAELAKFIAYREAGLQEFPLSDIARSDRGPSPRQPGAPFILSLQQWLMLKFRLSEAEAWDYPAGLAKMRWAAYWESEGGLDIYNAHEAEFDEFVARNEAKINGN